MAEHQPIKREKTEEVEESRHKKKAQQPLYDQLKAPDEGIVDSLGVPSVDRHAALLADAHSDRQRANLVIQLQQSYGNAYVQRLINSRVVQAKLTVNPPDDVYEREADRVADTIQRQIEEEEEEEEELMMKTSQVQRQPIEEEEEELQMKTSQVQRQPIEEEEEELMMKTSQVQRQPIEEEEEALMMKTSQVQRQEEEEEELLQAKPAGSQPSTVSENLETRINDALGGGQSLADPVRAPLELHFKHDFSQVRIHTDAKANTLSRQLDAEAFTTGHDIFFREGSYQPDSESGRELIAHELAHVVQQQSAPALQQQSAEEQHEAAHEAPASRGFDAATAARMRDQIMTPIEQAANEGLATSPPDIRKAVSLIAQAIVTVGETRFEAGGFDEDAAARMRHAILTPLEQAGEMLSASISAPERAMELLSQAIIETSSLSLEAAAG